MKRLLAITLITFSVLLSGALVNKTAAQVQADVSYQNFYDELSPYGQWIDYPEYGYVWVPNEGRDFRPYSTGGRWVWSDDYEWMWVSDYSWGWAPFHYGRWFEDPGYGWMWMPGYEWAPAWVAWRDGGDYYGWAPLRPGINISIGFSLGSYNPPVDYWCFAPRQYITSNRIGSYCLDRSRNVTIINNTTIINNYSRRSNNIFVTGPGRRDAERYAGRITPVRFRESSRPGRAEVRNNHVSIYRPNVQRDNDRRFAPRSYNNYNGNGRNSGNAGRNGNGNDLPGRRNVFDRGDNNDRPGNSNGRVSDRTANPGDNNNRGNTPERRNVFDRNNNNNGSNREGRVPDRTTNPGNNNGDRPAENPARRNVFDRNNNSDRTNDNNRRVERRNTEATPPARSPQTERRNVFDRSAQQPQQRVERQQPPQQRVERQQPQQRMERPQQPQQRTERQQPQQRMERPQPQQRVERQQPQQRVERSQPQQRSSGNENRGGGDNGRRNVFDRRNH